MAKKNAFLKMSKKCPKWTKYFSLPFMVTNKNIKSKKYIFFFKSYPKLSILDNCYPFCPFLSIFGQVHFLDIFLQKKNYGKDFFLCKVVFSYLYRLKRNFHIIFSVEKKKFFAKISKWTKKKCPK